MVTNFAGEEVSNILKKETVMKLFFLPGADALTMLMEKHHRAETMHELMEGLLSVQ